MALDDDLESIVLPREQIAYRVSQLGRQISEDYRGCDLVLVAVLKGSIVFLSDLMRVISIPHRFDLVRAASYGSSTTSSGHVAVTYRPELPLAGRDVLIVEDVLDTGRTVEAISREIEERGPRSLALCVLLSKRRERVADVKPRYVGFEIPDRFVVGYGLDYDERYRHLDCVAILKPSVWAGTQLSK
ncbi:hypoxanthine phosphoribosyltransferase [Candidatus Sumerlaeota bacterium]|nr:hypoxanthine phosphoribosyltransferase [Candidatus Sumerlaeota bacterium]